MDDGLGPDVCLVPVLPQESQDPAKGQKGEGTMNQCSTHPFCDLIPVSLGSSLTACPGCLAEYSRRGKQYSDEWGFLIPYSCLRLRAEQGRVAVIYESGSDDIYAGRDISALLEGFDADEQAAVIRLRQYMVD